MASPAPGQRKIDFPDHANISRNMFANERLDIARMPSTPAECPSGLRSATQEQLTILRLFGSEKPFLHMNVCDHSRVLCTRGFEPHFSHFSFETYLLLRPLSWWESDNYHVGQFQILYNQVCLRLVFFIKTESLGMRFIFSGNPLKKKGYCEIFIT